MTTGSWIYQLDAGYITLALAAGMGLAAFWGVSIARRNPQVGADSGPLATSIFGLLGLLLAFTFSRSGARYDTQRDLIIIEANAIATAGLRADMYPEPHRSTFRRALKGYLESRITDNAAGFADSTRMRAERTRKRLEGELWALAARLSLDPRHIAATQQMVPALGQLFDTATQRIAADRNHVPDEIIALLVLACVIGAFYGAYLTGRASHFDWLAMAGFTALCCAVVYVVLDVERPRRGLIDLEISNQSLIDVRPTFD